VRRRGAGPLAPYEDLIDLCRARKYRVHLDWCRYGWQLDVFDKATKGERGDLIARGTSTRPVPECFKELAAHAAAGLSRSGKANP
jgi:hypothetical protein